MLIRRKTLQDAGGWDGRHPYVIDEATYVNVLLRGDLGAGKTTLAKGIAEGFGAARAEDVTSPTFTLVHEYRGPRVTLFHIDLYRIDTERELETLGLDDLLAPNCILLIEWGEKFPRLRSDQNVEITLERVGETERRIQVTNR